MTRHFTVCLRIHSEDIRLAGQAGGEAYNVALRVLLAVNTHARRGRGALELATQALHARGHDVIVVESSDRESLSAAIAAHAGRIDAAMVGGGDGTLIGAIEGLRSAAVPLAILPLGTINELARTLAIPFDLQRACALLDGGRAHPIDVGCVNGVTFFNEASIGLSTHVAREQTGEIKSRWGMLAIPVATLRSLRALRPYHLDVTKDTDAAFRLRTMQLTVANSFRFGGVVENPTARIDDGLLDLYSIELRRFGDAISVIHAVATKRFPNAQAIVTMRGVRFTVESKNTHRVYADGEPATTTPAEFTVIPGAVSVYVPH
jgi:diacylglycerol kinase (ATP)